MPVGRWYVQLSAIWHWDLPLYIYVILYCVVVSAHSFFSLSFFRFFHVHQSNLLFIFNLVFINQTGKSQR